MEAKIFNIQKFSLHDGPGIRTCIFFNGCNLRCKWCANPECFTMNKDVQIYDENSLLGEVLKDELFYKKSGGGVTLTGGEIFLQFDFIKSFCKILKENNIHTAIETSANTDNSKFQEIVNLVDFVYIDCKHYDDEKHIEGTGVSNDKILENIKWLCQSGKPYCVRIPVIPEYNSSPEDARNFSQLFSELGVKNPELLPFHQFGENKYKDMEYHYRNVKALHKEDLKEYYKILKLEVE